MAERLKSTALDLAVIDAVREAVGVGVERSKNKEPGFTKIVEALCKAQSDFKPIEKKRKAKIEGKTQSGSAYSYTFNYADLSDILNTVRPILSQHGIAIVQPVYQVGDYIMIQTWLIHTSGERLESGEMPAAPLNAKLSQQKIGGAITYARRMQLAPMIGIVAEETTDSEGEEDTDEVRVAASANRKRSAASPKPTVGKEKKKLAVPAPPPEDAADPYFNPEEFLSDIEDQFIAAGQDRDALNEVWLLLDGEDRLVGPDKDRANTLVSRYLDL